MSSSKYKLPNSSLASYESSKPYPQLDGHSDSRRNIPEGGLAKDNVSVMTIKPQDNTLPTITVKAPLPSPTLSTFSFLVSFEKFHVTAASKAEVEATSTPTINIIHHKSFHANVIYEKYNSNSRQKIFSNRLGISYTTRYDAHDLNLILPPNKAIGSMYTKIYENFSRTISSNPRTAVRQKAYFDRSCRRIFSSNKPKSGMALKLRHKIRLANQRKFLFYPYQKICKRLPHLKFNMGLFKRFPTVPLFRFPYDRNCALLHLYEDRILPSHITPGSSWVIKNQDSDEEDDSSADNGRDDTSENSYRDWFKRRLHC
ncbi:uncharacterized protein OCT59_015878 [Rhizophagus irregularis]|uniref:uncharacterized protein n=1 Tax=Rhizophagus irregularis TaxID=588596 RepID=UPI00332D88DF|nr:hypothetical protein OCT59_015878 [Rhizophagus irregularis]